MKYSESLRKKQDFAKAYKEGRSRANALLVLYARQNQLSYNRIGISVSRKVGNSVIRHRITRLIRESYRLSEDDFRSGYDFVVIARVKAKGTTYEEIRSALLCLAKGQHVLKETAGMEEIK